MEAHHFCKHVSEDFHQCIIFDSGEPDAKLIGIEYIASEKVCVSIVGGMRDDRLTLPVVVQQPSRRRETVLTFAQI